ncbi:metallophosphoesterase family protein [Thermodesulfobacteriota bacterium]
MVNDKEITAAVFSDTHGNQAELRDAIFSNGPFDMIIHVGDGVLDGEAAAKEFGIKFCAVAGNEDLGLGFPEKKALEINRWSFLLLHGHQTEINPYQPKAVWEQHIQELCRVAARANAQVLLFGHTHQPMLMRKDGIILCNPGDQHRGSSDAPTFALLKVKSDSLDLRVMKKEGEKKWAPILKLSTSR